MFQPNESIGSVLDRNRGVGPGFDVLRIALAAVIFMGHVSWLIGRVSTGAMPSNLLNGHQSYQFLQHSGWEGWKRPIQVSWVPAFFALSGFLVTGSALRTKAVQTFLAFRALRIWPALLVELTLSALILGLFFTTLDPGAYIRDPGFFRYFGNLIGIVDFQLPGVYSRNPVPWVVNANLWTLPAEFNCYLITAVLMLSGAFYRRGLVTFLFLALTVVFIVLNCFGDFSVSPTTFPVETITYYFFAGVIFYHWRDLIPVNWPLFLISLGLSYALQRSHHTMYLAPIFLTYCTIFVGMLPFRKIPLISSGDYSYGVYLYGFPITQAVIATWPEIAHHRWLTLIFSGVLTLCFAAFSWHVIEKRALNLKRNLPPKWFPTPERATKPTLVAGVRQPVKAAA